MITQATIEPTFSNKHTSSNYESTQTNLVTNFQTNTQTDLHLPTLSALKSTQFPGYITTENIIETSTQNPTIILTNSVTHPQFEITTNKETEIVTEEFEFTTAEEIITEQDTTRAETVLVQTSEIQTNIPIIETTTLSASTNSHITSDHESTYILTTTISPYLTMDFCPGAAKTIDCSASGELVYILDAFYGASDQVPAVCEYKYV